MSAGKLRERAADAARDRRVIEAVHLATLRKVDVRGASMEDLRNPEALRTLAAEIKQHTLEHLPELLEQFVERVRDLGGHVHFARDAAEAQRVICEIARTRGLKLAVKAKSMTTEEVHLNDALEAAGLRVLETDLGEFIVQLDRDRPSHIVTPIIHKDRKQVAAAMSRELGCEYTEDPETLTRIARAYLRDVFRRCDLGITGVNFGVAETGTLCLCTNEGNGRMSATRPRVHVALMGIEKVIPRMQDLSVFLKLLARSSTGQPLTVYTSLINGPKRAADADGPEELHVVLLDNGRSEILRGEFAEVLRCIRCGACLNACPVYRNVGGHAYNSVYPGPIGSLITPLLDAHVAHAELPRASSLCGQCEMACPVKIEIPDLLLRLRTHFLSRQPLSKKLGMRAWRFAMEYEPLYRMGQFFLRNFVPAEDGWIEGGVGPLKDWTSIRDLPQPPERSFRKIWDEELRNEG